MNYIISGRNVDVSDKLRGIVEKKLGKLEKYFKPDTDIIVTLSVEKDRRTAEVTIPVRGNIIRTEQTSDDMYVSIELAADVIERQLKKYRTKLISKKQESAEAFQPDFLEEEAEDDESIKIVKAKRFGIKPMFPEDACIQMELLGHTFYVFENAETAEVNVVYKRKDGAYGLIEPIFDAD